jgi:predicted component of type VI protein secretion system
VGGPRVYDGDMASVETTKLQVRVRRRIESMDDLTPEERARQLRFVEKLEALAGKIHLDIDLDELRGRCRCSAVFKD